MKASEARKLSQEVADEKEKARAKRNKELTKAARETEEKKRLEFLSDLRKYSRMYIADAVKEGKRRTERTLATWDKQYESYPDHFLKNHIYADETRQVMKEIEADGFKVTLEAHVNTYRTQHESSVPDYNYYDYDTKLVITW